MRRERCKRKQRWCQTQDGARRPRYSARARSALTRVAEIALLQHKILGAVEYDRPAVDGPVRFVFQSLNEMLCCVLHTLSGHDSHQRQRALSASCNGLGNLGKTRGLHSTRSFYPHLRSYRAGGCVAERAHRAPHVAFWHHPLLNNIRDSCREMQNGTHRTCRPMRPISHICPITERFGLSNPRSSAECASNRTSARRRPTQSPA